MAPLLLSLLCAALAAPHAFVGATVHPVSGPPIADGVVIIDGATITAVGPRAAVSIPAGATVHELAGRQRTQCEAVSGGHRVGQGHRAPLRERDLGAGSEAGLDDRDVVGRVHLDRALGEGEGRAGLGCGQRAFSGRESLL